ncbi:zincin-like metallopeptidase domain-containing protein [Legionella pneumophila serogroup 1]
MAPQARNRESLKAYGTEKGRAEEELVAEFGAFFLCAFFKIKSDIENHASYVNSWKTLLNEKEIMRATNMAAKAFHYLVEPLQKEQAQIAA